MRVRELLGWLMCAIAGAGCASSGGGGSTDEAGGSERHCAAEENATAIGHRRGAVKSCYEQRLAAGLDPSTEVRVTVLWTIESDGSVRDVDVSGGPDLDEELAGCLMRVLARARFPEQNGGVCMMRLPLTLSAGSD
jgi:hypothetical protein